VGSHHAHVDEILGELVVHERSGIELYERLLELVAGKNLARGTRDDRAKRPTSPGS
jgi:hypothetical protein